MNTSRRSSSGSAHEGVAGTFQTVTPMSMRTRSNQFLLAAILVILWTARCQWDPIYIPCCCIVFKGYAPDSLYTKIATIRCAGDPCYQFCSLSVGLLWRLVFAGLPSACDIRSLQSVLNSPVRLVTVLGNMITWRLGYVITNGCRLSRE